MGGHSSKENDTVPEWTLGWMELRIIVLLTLALGGAAHAEGLAPADLYRLKTVEDVQTSPDGKRVTYRIKLSDKPGRRIRRHNSST